MGKEKLVAQLDENRVFDLVFRAVWHGQEGNLSSKLVAFGLSLPTMSCMDLDGDSLEVLESFAHNVGEFTQNYDEVGQGGMIDWKIMGELWEGSTRVLSILEKLDDEEYQERYYQDMVLQYELEPDKKFETYGEAIANSCWARMTDPSSLVGYGEEFRSRLGLALKMTGRRDLQEVDISLVNTLDRLLEREEYSALRHLQTTIVDKVQQEGDEVRIQADSDLFEYMMGRLLSNFCRQLLEEKSNKILVRSDGNKLYIADDGAGFSEDYISRWQSGEMMVNWRSNRIDMGGGVGMSMVRILSNKLGLNVVLSNGKFPQYPSACVEIDLTPLTTG